MLRRKAHTAASYTGVAVDDSSVWLSVKILVQVLNFIIIKLLKFNALCTSAGSIIPLWIIKDSQIQFPPRWCHRAAEWMEKWTSPCWFALLITQTSLLPPLRVREEKGQSSDSHKDLITMHVTAQPAPPARVTLWRKCHGCASLNTLTGLLRQGHWCTREEEKHHRMTQKPISHMWQMITFLWAQIRSIKQRDQQAGGGPRLPPAQRFYNPPPLHSKLLRNFPPTVFNPV